MRDSIEKALGRFRLRIVADNVERDPTGRHPAWQHRLPETWRRWLKGRAWLRRENPDGTDYERGEVSAEWVLNPTLKLKGLDTVIGFGVDLGPTMMSDDDPTYLGGNIQLMGNKLFLSCTGLIPERFLPGNRIIPGSGRPAPWRKDGSLYYARTPGRQIGLDLRDWTIWGELWSRGDGNWSNTDPCWQSFNVDLRDLVFGPMHIDSKDEPMGEVQIPMPEGVYTATAKLCRVTWKRWHFVKRWWSISFDDMRGPNGETCIPYPGKGESAHNCGMDGLYSMSCVVGLEMPEAIASVVSSVLRTRQKRTGKMFWEASKEELDELTRGPGGSEEEAAKAKD